MARERIRVVSGARLDQALDPTCGTGEHRARPRRNRVG
jgi:hypothetical protein